MHRPQNHQSTYRNASKTLPLLLGLCASLGCGRSERANSRESVRATALSSSADGVRIDFGTGALNQLQARYTAWENTEFQDFPAIGGFTATIKRIDGTSGVEFRDNGNTSLPGEIANLAEDGVVFGAGLRLTFTGLKPAIYHFKAYHHDATHSQGTIDVFVTDADSSNRHVADEVPVTTGTNVQVIGSTTFTFRSNGTSAVVIDFKDGAVPGEVWLNGFGLTRSPYHAAARADLGATGQQLESKHTAWTNTESRNFLQIDGFDATVKRADGVSGVDWFDRGDVSGTLGNLVEDGVKSPSGLRLTFTGLEAGRYSLKTYHHDATVTQGTIDIFVDDVGRTNAQVADEVKVSNGTSSPTITSATFEFTADGTNDVRVYFRQGGVAGQPLFNGFELNKVYRELVVSHIERTPRYHRYDLTYGPVNTSTSPGVPTLCADNVGKKRWPDVGEMVTYTGVVVNTGTTATPPAQYRWILPGGNFMGGPIGTLGPGESRTVTMSRAFPGTPENIELVADFHNDVLETDETNNSLQITSHDLTLSIWVERGLYDLFRNSPTAVGSPSFEDWMRRQIAHMNQRFAASTYHFASNGIVDRVRIDKLMVVDDVDRLNHTGESCVPEQNDPDKTLIDGRWSFKDWDSSNQIGQSWSWQNYLDWADTFVDRVDTGLVHELAHQLGLIDLYRMNLTNWPPTCTEPTRNYGFEVRDASGQVIDAGALPSYGFNQLLFKFPGVMAGSDTRPHLDGTYFEDHSVGGMNAHVRKRRGYFGEYLFDTPSDVYVRVLDKDGLPLPVAAVQLFQKAGDWVDNIPEHEKTADLEGRIHLDNKAVTSFTTETGHTLRDNIFGRIHHEGWNGTMFVRATTPIGVHYGWLFVTDLNLAYWSGHQGTVQCTLKLQPPKTPPPITNCDNPWPGGAAETPPRDQFVCQPYTP